MTTNDKRRLIRGVLGLGLVALTGGARADGVKPRSAAADKEQKPWGVAGDPKDAGRSIECKLLDTMRFSPDLIDVTLGETIRFTAVNRGRVMHEFVIGTPEENAAHYELMKKFPKMEHDAPYMAHVRPGRRGQIVWHFNRPGEFEFACLIRGHYEAGMVGRILVKSA